MKEGRKEERKEEVNKGRKGNEWKRAKKRNEGKKRGENIIDEKRIE